MTSRKNNYNLIQEFQSDTTCTISLCHDTLNNIVVIMKKFDIPMCLLEGIDYSHELKLMLAAQASAKSGSTNVVQLLTHFYTNIDESDVPLSTDATITNNYKSLHLIIEFVNAGSVSDLLDSYPQGLRESFVAYITAQILTGLRHLHAQNIAHRDLKPDNFLVENNSENTHAIVKIADFGVSQQSTIEMTDFIGTLHYIPPQIAKRQNYTKKCDVWSLGVCVLEMILGSVPYHTMNGLEFTRTILGEDDYNPLHHITMDQYQTLSDEARDFVNVCCAHDEVDREGNIDTLLQHAFITKYEGFDIGRLLCKVVKRTDQ